MTTCPTVVESLALLHRAGWSVGEITVLMADGRPAVLGTGQNGENLINAEGATAAEAWWRAVEQARSVGMLRGTAPPVA
jgi:hypothetical protein